MPLIVSCLSDDPRRVRAMIDRLRLAGWPPQAITVLYADTPAPTAAASAADTGTAAAAVAGGSGAAVAGAFGWLVGYGVLAIPAAVVGGALAGAAGAAVGAGAAVNDDALRRAVLDERRSGLSGTMAAVVVHADDARGYDTVVGILRSEGGRELRVVGRGRLEPGAAAHG